MFRFASPDYLYLLFVVPLAVALFVYAERDRRRRLERFGDRATLAALMPDVSRVRVHVRQSIYLLAMVCMIFALARPQVGSRLKEVKREGIEIMLAVDVSNSMLAEDFQPSRLERTKYAIDRLLEGLNQDRIGLVVFAGDAYVQLPITSDYLTARNFTRQISTDMVSKQGTAIGAAIDMAASSFSSQSEGSRVIVLITDGENHEDDALGAARRAADKGIKIYTIGIGTPEGAPIRLDGDFIKDEKGDMVVSKLDEATLREVALLTGGAYIRSTKQSLGLSEIIEQINKTEKSEFTATMFEEFDEQYAYFAGAALGLLIVGWAILPRRNRFLSRFGLLRDNGR